VKGGNSFVDGFVDSHDRTDNGDLFVREKVRETSDFSERPDDPEGCD